MRTSADSRSSTLDGLIQEIIALGRVLDQQSNGRISLSRPRSSLPHEITVTALSVKSLEEGIIIKAESDVTIVDWDGPEDSENPMNWPFKRKWVVTAILSGFTFISTVSSSMVAPAANQVAKEFGVTNTVVIAMTTSMFVLGQAFGPLFFAPLSEIYGRSHVLQFANLFYLVWNIACGGAKSQGQIIAFRFLSGLGGSAPFPIDGGVIGDCWRREERGQAIALFTLAPLFGIALGPVAGAWIAELSSWRWVFWSTSIGAGVVQLLGLLFLRETFAPLLLERKASRIKKQLGIISRDQSKVRTKFQSEERQWTSIFAKAIIRPFALFVREPVIQLLGLYMAFVYGIVYLTLTTLPDIFEGVYHFRVGIAGLHYLSLGVGLVISNQINASISDRVYVYLKNRNEGVGKPEFRLPTMVLGTLCLPSGLLMTGWTSEKVAHWILPDIGIAILGAGMNLNIQGIQTYIIEAFSLYSASALATVTCLRSLTGFGFPLFAPAMYDALGYGKSGTILASAAILLGCPAPFLFWHYGERIRHLSLSVAD
ncbi:MFS polyamine transporter [Rickenella mellea]|uniref:MFS polyamine transporter n=1 Tax=Rickenella mellea TaxID=50990 RepID=A0A4Y7PLB4_9AGAM|nr:MFS polyamine transporter [Rickenella mellea]